MPGPLFLSAPPLIIVFFLSRGTGISVRCEELLKGNGISGGTARVSWCERELLIGQNHILFYFIFSCLFKIQNNYYQRSHSWILECKLNPYWSKLRLRETHDIILFSFFICPLIPKTPLTKNRIPFSFISCWDAVRRRPWREVGLLPATRQPL